ncbi:MAG: hypothetical protein ROR55_10145 [Devosia sp.]
MIPYIVNECADGAIACGKPARDDKSGILMVMDHMAEFGEPPAKDDYSFTPQLVTRDGEALLRREEE